MRVSKAMVILFLVFSTTYCVTERAQKKQDDTQATPANIQAIKSDEPFTQRDTQKVRNEEWLTYEPTVVELKGKLITKTFYGPPNYGENPDTDSKEEFAILVLSKPVNVRGNADPDAGYERTTVKHLREMQLVLTMPHKELIGKKVIVKGTLFHAFTGHHHTDVLMFVQSISPAALE